MRYTNNIEDKNEITAITLEKVHKVFVSVKINTPEIEKKNTDRMICSIIALMLPKLSIHSEVTINSVNCSNIPITTLKLSQRK